MHNRKYTLITGSSEGFGRALAIECASRKMNLILVALPGPELNNLADHIKSHYWVDVVTLEKDLSIEEECVMVFNIISELGLSVNMLINNVGVGSTMLFSEGSVSFYQKQIKLNTITPMLLTHLFLDMLKENGPSHILNVGSLSSYFYLPKKPVYGPTKSFIYGFSKCLRRELKNDNINVSVVCPGNMNTNAVVVQLNKSSNWVSRQSVMNPDKVALIALEGLLKCKEVIIPGFVNKCFLVINKLLPSFVVDMIISNQMKKINSALSIQQRVHFTQEEEKLTA